jgi:hypothetical protein
MKAWAPHLEVCDADQGGHLVVGNTKAAMTAVSSAETRVRFSGLTSMSD